MLPPGPRLPPAAQALAWAAWPDVLLRGAARRHGEPFTLRLPWSPAPMVLVWSPEAVRAVYRAAPDVLQAGQSSAFLAPFVGPDSLLLLDGPPHLACRRLLAAPFRGDRLRALAPIVAARAAAEVATWAPGRALRTLPRMRALTLDVALHAILGGEDPGLRTAIRAALDRTASLPRLLALSLARPDRRPRSPWGAFRRTVDDVDRLLYARIAARRVAPGDAVVDDLVAAGAGDREIRDHLVTLLAAGHETTATALAWALERLARAPDVAAWARAGGDAELDAVVREVLRVRPVLSVTPRRVVAPFAVAGHVLAPGVDVAACVWLAHRRPEAYEDPEAFAPARWLDGGAARDATAWIPFGGGVRRCLGAAFAALELREVLRVVLDRVDLAPDRAAAERVRRRSVTLAPARDAVVVPRPRAPVVTAA